jgi:hypothetical protein
MVVAIFGSCVPAVAPAHLLRRSRDAMVLHPIFSATVATPDIPSPVFLDVLWRSATTYEIL